jgi:hypothetical protein
LMRMTVAARRGLEPQPAWRIVEVAVNDAVAVLLVLMSSWTTQSTVAGKRGDLARQGWRQAPVQGSACKLSGTG